MPRLFTYTIPIDDGSAPNPFRGMCSLAICKPGIRRTAKEGDWIAGLGSKKAPSGDLSGHLVYAMRVDEVLSLIEYDQKAQRNWSHRIPNIKSSDMTERLGDCIYDFSNGKPIQRPGVHGPGNQKTDLSGENVLLSRHFFYFGGKAIPLPKKLLPICHQGRGHKSDSNDSYFDIFEQWLTGLKLKPGQLYGWPDFVVKWRSVGACETCKVRKKDGECDDPC